MRNSDKEDPLDRLAPQWVSTSAYLVTIALGTLFIVIPLFSFWRGG